MMHRRDDSERNEVADAKEQGGGAGSNARMLAYTVFAIGLGAGMGGTGAWVARTWNQDARLKHIVNMHNPTLSKDVRRYEMGCAIIRTEDNQEKLALLRPFLDGSDQEMKIAAIRKLMFAGKRGVMVLASYLEDPEPKVVATAAEELKLARKKLSHAEATEYLMRVRATITKMEKKIAEERVPEKKWPYIEAKWYLWCAERTLSRRLFSRNSIGMRRAPGKLKVSPSQVRVPGKGPQKLARSRC